MIDEFLTNVDKKLDELNLKIDNLEGNKKIEILDVSDIMEILKVNRNTANSLFTLSDFPAIKGIKSRKVEKQAFYQWLQRKGELKK